MRYLLYAVQFFVAISSILNAEQDRPNILWITCEDSNPHLGSYGDTYAVTPVLDQFATESVRYTQAFAYTGACSPSRSCLITGIYPLTLGTHQMRTTMPLPPTVRCFPTLLREAGYYTSNNYKEDYQFVVPSGTWDDSSDQAHWRNRAPNQPFFSVFNLKVTHQSRIFADTASYLENTRRLTPEQRRDPSQLTIPPIHPDTPEFRRDWARHYENVTAMDYQVGDILAELKADGLADDTIVFFFSDHGTGMPGIKMWAWGPSLRVPLIIRFPPKWRHLAPAAPGESDDRLVSFVDFAPTVLSLAGIPQPPQFQGYAFLGSDAAPPREFIFGGKDRQSEITDTIRYVRDHRFQYIRNFRPHLPHGQFMSYNWRMSSMQSWDRHHQEGKLSGPPARFFDSEKETEELYDVTNDPWQVYNLATNPRYKSNLKRLRTELRNQMVLANDLGLLPENELHRRSQNQSPMLIGNDPRLNPLYRLMLAADLANARDPANLDELVSLLSDKDAAIRWWAATGLLSLGATALPARDELLAATRDTSSDVQLAAAEALARMGETDTALATIRELLKVDNVFTRLAALNSVERLGPAAVSLVTDVQRAGISNPTQKDTAIYVERMVRYLPERILNNTHEKYGRF
ncbi:sulfatase-like hydrolase/transferase [Opitutia bacterium ISCC 51]|nr:sulfatase-like hydrolase/transferase [Opitutae bacterium ISCC 51]QXD29446.1 sulfatase-like hydrolase/transferase [Opitutae bacterium ISCC 52]